MWFILKSCGLKGTHSTELFYGVGRGEHTALVSSVRGNTKRCDTGSRRRRSRICALFPPAGGSKSSENKFKSPQFPAMAGLGVGGPTLTGA